MVKHNADPMRAMILSKDGTMIARTVMTKMLKKRIAPLIISRVNLGALASLASGDARGSSPKRISIVLDTGAILLQRQSLLARSLR